VCILLTVAFLLLYYYGFELNPRNGCTLAQRVSSKSYTRIKNCCINSTIRSIILACCTNVTLLTIILECCTNVTLLTIILACCTNVTMGPLYLSQIKCTLVGMHSDLQHKSKPLAPIRSGTQQHYLSPQGGILWYKCHTTTIFL